MTTYTKVINVNGYDFNVQVKDDGTIKVYLGKDLAHSTDKYSGRVLTALRHIESDSLAHSLTFYSEDKLAKYLKENGWMTSPVPAMPPCKPPAPEPGIQPDRPWPRRPPEEPYNEYCEKIGRYSYTIRVYSSMLIKVFDANEKWVLECYSPVTSQMATLKYIKSDAFRSTIIKKELGPWPQPPVAPEGPPNRKVKEWSIFGGSKS